MSDWDYRDVLVSVGLGRPAARGFVAGVATASLLYCTGTPKDAFDENGACKPFALLSPGPDSTMQHFLAIPITVAVAVYLFT
jgi:hypothetical protein